MIDSLGESAKLALSYARRIAAALKADLIETEHVFLGVGELEDVAIRDTLAEAHLDIDDACRRLRLRLVAGTGPGDPEVRLSPETRHILAQARALAATLEHPLVEAHHLMAALLGLEHGLVSRVLYELGVDRAAAYRRLTGIMESGDTTPPDFYRGRRSIAQADLGKTTKVLESLGRDLTLAAEEGKLSPIIGRDREVAEVVKILLGKRKNNAILIGEAGVGKTAVAEGLAQRIVAHEIPQLDGMRVRTIEVGSLVAGTIFRGQFEQRLKDLIDSVRERDDMILFIDEMHMLVGAGESGAGGSMDAANMLKPVLSEGSLKVIGATTTDEYRKYLEPDRALMRRFQPVIVGEPSREDALTILRGIRPRYEAFHLVRIEDEALEAAVDLSTRYLHERQLPDKALDLLDRACTNAKLESAPSQPEGERPVVTAEEIAGVVSVLLEIPIASLTTDERDRLRGMTEWLMQRVSGQEAAVRAVSQAILRARTGFGNPDRPYGVFLFLGPTGVGKTKLAEELATYLFADRKELIAFDMSQYVDAFAISELVGNKTGVVGWQEGGKLTNAVRGKPYSVVLLDELEKAHPSVWNLFLPIFDNGRITDALGRTIDFRNTVIIATSNIGAGRFRARRKIGFSPGDDAIDTAAVSVDDVRSDVLEDLRQTFPLEFLNRFDEIVIFNPLTRDDIRTIVRRRIEETVPVRLVAAPEALEFLLEESYDPAMGARPVRRAIQRLVANPLSLMVASGELRAGDTVEVAVSNGQLTFTLVSNPPT